MPCLNMLSFLESVENAPCETLSMGSYPSPVTFTPTVESVLQTIIMHLCTQENINHDVPSVTCVLLASFLIVDELDVVKGTFMTSYDGNEGERLM